MVGASKVYAGRGADILMESLHSQPVLGIASINSEKGCERGTHRASCPCAFRGGSRSENNSRKKKFSSVMNKRRKNAVAQSNRMACRIQQLGRCFRRDMLLGWVTMILIRNAAEAVAKVKTRRASSWYRFMWSSKAPGLSPGSKVLTAAPVSLVNRTHVFTKLFTVNKTVKRAAF